MPFHGGSLGKMMQPALIVLGPVAFGCATIAHEFMASHPPEKPSIPLLKLK